MRRRYALAVLASVLVIQAAWPGVPAEAVALSCRGVPATIVGTPGETVHGTGGPDVIVSNGANFIFAHNGNDVVCTTRSHLGGPVGVSVSDGGGDDLVDTSGDTVHKGTFTLLLGGDDTFVGGPARDTVNIAARGGDDSVETGDGADQVLATDPNGADVVHLGAGADKLTTDAALSPTIVLDGGPDDDLIMAARNRTGSWVFDNVTGQAFRDGQLALAWNSFERFDLRPGSDNGSTRFVGGDLAELVVLSGVLAGADTGGGNDKVRLVRPQAAVPGSALVGGADHDVLFVGTSGVLLREARADLPGQLVTTVHNGHTATQAMSGFEQHELVGRSVTIAGSPAADRLGWSGCRVRIHGRGGDDTIRWAGPRDFPPRRCRPFVRSIAVRGNDGDDLLAGSRYADTLDGGAGIDTARGGSGRDRCAAEVRRSCELLLA